MRTTSEGYAQGDALDDVNRPPLRRAAPDVANSEYSGCLVSRAEVCHL